VGAVLALAEFATHVCQFFELVGTPYAFGDNVEPEGGDEIDDAAHAFCELRLSFRGPLQKSGLSSGTY
jgi:hypothetical protein